MSERGWCAKSAVILGRAQVGGWAHGEYPKGYARSLYLVTPDYPPVKPVYSPVTPAYHESG